MQRHVQDGWVSAIAQAAALLCVSLGGTGCDDDSPANRYFHAAEDLHAAICACGSGARGPCNARFETFVSCQLGVVREYEDEIGDFLDCAAKHTVGQTRCVQRAGCDSARLESCLDSELDDRCGEPPEPAADRIDDEIDARCDDDRGEDCENGSCDGDSSGAGPVQVDPGMSIAAGSGGSPAAGAGAAAGVPGSSADPTLECVDITVANGAELVSLGCAQCLCTISAQEIARCDATCWQLIRCAIEHCGFPDADMDLMCLQESCPMTFVPGATSALTLSSTARDRCRNACPQIVP